MNNTYELNGRTAVVTGAASGIGTEIARTLARSGARVNVSSIGAHLAFPNYAVYTATKAAVTHLSANLRTEFGALGVRVTNIEPGLVSTELGDHMDNPDVDAHLAAWREEVPPLNPSDIADVVGFVTSRPRQVNLRQVIVLPTSQV